MYSLLPLLANEQSRLGKLTGNEPKIDEGAVHVVFTKSLDNYIKWCSYLPQRPVWNNTDSLTKKKVAVCVFILLDLGRGWQHTVSSRMFVLHIPSSSKGTRGNYAETESRAS